MCQRILWKEIVFIGPQAHKQTCNGRMYPICVASWVRSLDTCAHHKWGFVFPAFVNRTKHGWSYLVSWPHSKWLRCGYSPAMTTTNAHVLSLGHVKQNYSSLFDFGFFSVWSASVCRTIEKIKKGWRRAIEPALGIKITRTNLKWATGLWYCLGSLIKNNNNDNNDHKKIHKPEQSMK